MAAGRQLLTIMTGILLAVAPLAAQTPTGTITGRVTDAASQQPIAGVTVAVAGRSTLTRDDGRYLLIGVPAGSYELRAEVIGYARYTRQVTVPADEAITVDFALHTEAILLEQLVAIGYGQRRAADVTGSVVQLGEEQFNTGRIISPEELIQGKIPGVRVVDSGEPGGGVSIRIRGGTSVNAGNEPLFVVDGTPLPHGGGLSAGRNPLNFLNPEDIQSITVLKDASSTAIYGSRGANGVILVTTKAGSIREPQFSYSNSFSTSRVTNLPDMMTPDQFRNAVAQFAPQHAEHLGDANTDWRDAVLRTAGGQEHSIGISGAGETMNYRLSLNYLDQQGVIRGSQTERLAVGLNYNHRLFEERMSVQATLRGARTGDMFTPGGGLGTASIFNPTQPIRGESGYYEYTAFPLGPNNPIPELELGVSEGTTFRTIGNVQANYRLPFVEFISLTGRVGFDVATSERRTFYPSTLYGQQKQDSLAGYLNRSSPRDANSVFEMYGTLDRRLDFLDSHLDFTAGHTYETTRGDRPFFEMRGLASDMLREHGIPGSFIEVTPRLEVFESRLASFFGRANYTIHDRYMLTLSVRRDGSSRFGPDNRWGTFPAAAVAWRVTDEPFLNVDALSDLKLRLSWGVNGNEAIGNYRWAPTYMFSDPHARAQFGDEFVTTIRPAAVDRNIKWEESTSYNAGIDYGFYDQRFQGTIDFYVKDTDDLLFEVNVPAGTFPSNRVLTNVGQVRNTGLELGLSADVLRGARLGGVTWNTSFNMSRNRNRVVRISPFGGDVERIEWGGIAGGVGSTIQTVQPGAEAFSFYVYRHRRDASGRPIVGTMLEMYEDINGDGIINQDDRVPFRSPAPDWTFGHTSQFGFRNVDLGFTLRAHLGNYVYNNLASFGGYYNRLTEAAGPINLHASAMDNGFVTPQFFSDVYVEDASFLRMDNITVGYTMPRVRGAQQIRVFGTIQNVFTMTGYSGVDPEAGLGGIDNNIYPRSRTFTVGVSAGF
jgi:TonB-dependent starch-binding outer membrane protein SusC